MLYSVRLQREWTYFKWSGISATLLFPLFLAFCAIIAPFYLQKTFWQIYTGAFSGLFRHCHLKIPYFVFKINILTGVCMINSWRLSVGRKSFGSSGFVGCGPIISRTYLKLGKQCLNIQTVITARQKSSNGPFHSRNFLSVWYWSSI